MPSLNSWNLCSRLSSVDVSFRTPRFNSVKSWLDVSKHENQRCISAQNPSYRIISHFWFAVYRSISFRNVSNLVLRTSTSFFFMTRWTAALKLAHFLCVPWTSRRQMIFERSSATFRQLSHSCSKSTSGLVATVRLAVSILSIHKWAIVRVSTDSARVSADESYISLHCEKSSSPNWTNWRSVPTTPNATNSIIGEYYELLTPVVSSRNRWTAIIMTPAGRFWSWGWARPL